jgi:hypothetical protein
MSHTKFVSPLGAPRLDRRQIKMGNEFAFRIESVRFDEDYRPSEKTRVTTNFATWREGRTGRRICGKP